MTYHDVCTMLIAVNIDADEANISREDLRDKLLTSMWLVGQIKSLNREVKEASQD